MKLRSWTLPTGEADALLSAWPEDSIVMAESAHQAVLTRVGDLPDIDYKGGDGLPEHISSWRGGHIFTDSGHVRWRRLGTSVRVVGGAEKAGEAFVPESWGEPDQVRDLSAATTEERDIALWGRRQPGEDLWLEVRIPNLMTEPDQHPTGHGASVEDTFVRRVLQVRTYRDPESAEVLAHRYEGIGYARTDDDDAVYEPLST